MIIDEEKVLEEHGVMFEDNFISDLDSWFSADLACCNGCYDGFVTFWPLANDVEFERSLIGIQSFYDGSKRCKKIYTNEEFDILISSVECPHCDESLSSSSTIWLYELPFKYDVNVTDFESHIYDLVRISETTPFLLLTNQFASNICEILKKLSLKTLAEKIEHPLYRARVATQIDQLSFDQFTLPPNRFIQEGRYNHAGQQALYLASDQQTCFQEVGSVLCYVAECEINDKIKILDLCNPNDSHPDFAIELWALAYSALMSRVLDTEGYHKPCYVFSRFITDCARLAGFDAIKYPSTKVTDNNFNLVILNNEIAKESLKFNSLTLKDNNQNYPISIATSSVT